jgi:signal peptidase I
MIGMLILFSIYTWHPSSQKTIKALAGRLQIWQRRTFEWLLAISIAIVGIWFINTYIFTFYELRSNSMRPALENNEFVFINKLAYGAAINVNSPDDYRRIQGYTSMTKGDVIAFHFPEADSNFVEYPNEDYYFIKRQYKNTRKYTPILDTEVQYKPVSKRKTFIKRLIATPGDTLQFVNGEYSINGCLSPFNKFNINKYRIKKDTPLNIRQTIRQQAITSYRENGWELIEIKAERVHQSDWRDYVSAVEETLNMPNVYVFPFKQDFLWNASYLGPLIIPTKNRTVQLSLSNIHLYKRIIESYELNQLKIEGDQIIINGKISCDYTFKMNYYWVSGDNRFHSFDSRFWGFVPENHIIGRVEKH